MKPLFFSIVLITLLLMSSVQAQYYSSSLGDFSTFARGLVAQDLISKGDSLDNYDLFIPPLQDIPTVRRPHIVYVVLDRHEERLIYAIDIKEEDIINIATFERENGFLVRTGVEAYSCRFERLC